MRKHTQIYFDALGLYPEEFTPCELCGKEAVDIHHLERRGMGGTTNPEANSIFNLMALCREDHDKFGEKVAYKDWLKGKHMLFLLKRGVRILGIWKEVNFKEDRIEFMTHD